VSLRPTPATAGGEPQSSKPPNSVVSAVLQDRTGGDYWVLAVRVPTKIAWHRRAAKMVLHRRFSWVPGAVTTTTKDVAAGPKASTGFEPIWGTLRLTGWRTRELPFRPPSSGLPEIGLEVRKSGKPTCGFKVRKSGKPDLR